MKKWVVLIIVLLIGGGIYAFSGGKEKALTKQDFEIMKVEKGRIVEEVTASGKIQPVNTVSVGTQVSGIVERVLVDYNDEVKQSG